MTLNWSDEQIAAMSELDLIETVRDVGRLLERLSEELTLREMQHAE